MQREIRKQMWKVMMPVVKSQFSPLLHMDSMWIMKIFIQRELQRLQILILNMLQSLAK